MGTQNYKGLEGQFFTWKGWDDIDTAAWHFYDCILLKDFGTFKKGDEITCVFFSMQNSMMEFYDNEGNPMGKFKLTIEAQPWE